MFTAVAPDDLARYIDLEKGLARIRGNKTVYGAMLASYEKDTSYKDMLGNLAAGDIAAAEMHCHSLKGLSGNLSFTALFEAATKLDALLKTGVSDDKLVEELGVIIEKTGECVGWVKANL